MSARKTEKEPEKTKARLTMYAPPPEPGHYATLVVQENSGDFSTTMLENAIEGNIPQHNLNPPWIIFGEDVPESRPITEPTDRALALVQWVQG